MKCEICGKETDTLITFEGKDMCGTCKRAIDAARKPENPRKGDNREYVEK